MGWRFCLWDSRSSSRSISGLAAYFKNLPLLAPLQFSAMMRINSLCMAHRASIIPLLSKRQYPDNWRRKFASVSEAAFRVLSLSSPSETFITSAGASSKPSNASSTGSIVSVRSTAGKTLTLNLEHVSGLSQHAVVQDVAAKIMCDNLQTLATMTARDQADLRAVDRIHHAYAHTALKPLMPALLLGKKVAKRLREVLSLIGIQTYLHRENYQNRANPNRSLTSTWHKNHVKSRPKP
jgi:hypothetical protein